MTSPVLLVTIHGATKWSWCETGPEAKDIAGQRVASSMAIWHTGAQSRRSVGPADDLTQDARGGRIADPRRESGYRPLLPKV